MIFFPADAQLIISNYSSTEIEIKSFLGDLRYLISKDALVATKANEYTINIASALDSMNIIDWTITANNVISPTFSSIDELINIINGWANSSHEISVNGANSVGMLNTLNFIEGTNITISTNYDPTNNVTDVQIDASGGGGGGVTSVTATGLLTSSGGTTPDISSSVAKGKLVGRNSVTAGIMEEITVAGPGLTLSGTTLSNSAPFTTPLTTKGDIYTRDASADTRLPVGLDTQVLLADSTTATGLKWGSNTTPPASGYYGAFSDVTNQFAAVINTGYPMLLGVTDLSNGVTVVSGSRVTIANTGIYNIQWSAQFTNPTASEHDVVIWLRKNGVDVPGSAGIVLVPPKHAGADGHALPSWNFLLDPIAGDYYEFVWSTDSTSVYITFNPAGSPPPSTASVVLTVTQQAGIMAGTGITAINSLTGAAQTLVAGTSGTTFDISSSGTTHTFNLPTASATNRGALSSTDWKIFNSKPNYLTAGYWNLGVQGGGTLSTISLPGNIIKFYKIYTTNTVTVTRLGCNVTNAGTAGSRGRLGIYSDVNGYPSALILDSGEFTCDSIAAKTLTGLSATLPAGVAWLCSVNNSVANVTFNSHPVSNLYPLGSLAPGGGLNANYTHYSGTFTYAALPANTSALTLSLLTTTVPAVYFYS